MGFQFDHLVHFVNSPLKSIEEFGKLGLYAVEGGKHENLGTYNALSYFDLSYIELIGVFDQQLVNLATDDKYSLRETLKNDHFEEGLSRIALRSSNLEADAEHFRSLGLEVYGPSPLSRRRPDGSLISWKLLYVGKSDEKLQLPFFIEWDVKDDERKQDLINQSAIAEHPRGSISISSVGFAALDFKDVVEKWSYYLNLKVEEPFIDESLNGKGQRLKLDGGDIILYSPIGEGIVSQTLKTRGEKPFLIEFSGSNQEEDFRVLGAIYRFSKKNR